MAPRPAASTPAVAGLPPWQRQCLPSARRLPPAAKDITCVQLQSLSHAIPTKRRRWIITAICRAPAHLGLLCCPSLGRHSARLLLHWWAAARSSSVRWSCFPRTGLSALPFLCLPAAVPPAGKTCGKASRSHLGAGTARSLPAQKAHGASHGSKVTSSGTPVLH